MLIPFRNPNKNMEEDDYYIGPWVARQFDSVKETIRNRDRDYVIIVDGDEGSGKSSLATQIAYYVDRTFNQERMCLTPSEFIEQINKCQKGQAVVFDEAFTGLASRSALSQINKIIVEMMMEMRRKNLFVILCIPSVFYLEKYVALHRARCLLHTFFHKKMQGRFTLYNKKQLQYLYLNGKTKMSYKFPTIRTQNRFYGKNPIDWSKYENRKIEALKNKTLTPLEEKQMFRRNFLVAWMVMNDVSREQIRIVSRDIGGCQISQEQISADLKEISLRLGAKVKELPKFQYRKTRVRLFRDL